MNILSGYPDILLSHIEKKGDFVYNYFLTKCYPKFFLENVKKTVKKKENSILCRKILREL